MINPLFDTFWDYKEDYFHPCHCMKFDCDNNLLECRIAYFSEAKNDRMLFLEYPVPEF